MGARQNYVEWRQRWPKVVVSRQTSEAVDLLQRYYASFDGDKPRYTGACFEAVAALNDDPDSLGPADFVAVGVKAKTTQGRVYADDRAPAVVTLDVSSVMR